MLFFTFATTPVAVAAFTVVLPALVAPIVDCVPFAPTAVIVLPLTVNALVLLLDHVMLVLGVPPLPQLLVAPVILVLYSTS